MVNEEGERRLKERLKERGVKGKEGKEEMTFCLKKERKQTNHFQRFIGPRLRHQPRHAAANSSI